VTSEYVVCVGAATLDTILAVPRHPAADDRVIASELVHGGGGPAATAAVTLARLGVPAYFVGAVGDDDVGETIRAGLAREGVDVSCLSVAAGARSYQSTILVSGAARAIVSLAGPAVVVDARAAELCRRAAWVHVDQAGYDAVQGLVGEARVSVDAGNPIPGLDLRGIALFAPTEAELLARFPGLGLEEAAGAALAEGAALVVVTRGSEGSVGFAPEAEPVHAPAFPVEPASTLGAGDVFHGALLAQLLRDAALAEALAAANACAALSCRALDGRSAIPTQEELASAMAGSPV
jgi:sugar/nucleoside kinase (ribokinase family)